ncbi:MAG TPA: prolyl oligopeptidase family serine peptidase, partial [Acidimicrobiales bacterium]|nr:prolyl oligopeptidase family serine peptidase [Acidimicrobiales bacterium]
EWEEWGNPLDESAAAAVIASYSPYENVRAVPYPAVLATTGVNDPRVSVHEPVKWVQQLRAVTTGDAAILLKIETGGHGGPTGRYDAWRDEAFVLAFALTHASGAERSDDGALPANR